MKNKIAEYKYIYDPEHKNKPSGNWTQTNSGWSSNHFNKKTKIKKLKNQPSNNNSSNTKNKLNND